MDRFAGFDTPVGAAAGDTVPPSVALTAPAAGLTLSAATLLTATASDTAGLVRVQFRVNDRDYGPVLTSPPFSVSLDPASLPAGNLVLCAVARDAAGNATTSGRRVVRNAVGRANFDGEVFVGDAALTQPVGVAVDRTGDVFIADQTRIWQYSPLGVLEQIYISTFTDPYPRSVAVAADGTVFATLQSDVIYDKDSLFAFSPQFPTGGLSALQRVCSPLPKVDHLAVDAAKRLYVPCALAGTNPARVVVMSGVQADTPLFALQHRLLNQPRDLAIDGDGNVYVVSTESRFWSGQSRSVANVVRYAAAARAAPESAAPPQILGAPQLLPGAGFLLDFDATPGAIYEIEASETLPGPFRSVGTVTAASGRVTWCDTGFGSGAPPASVPRRFYRVRLLGPAVLPP